MTLKNIMNEIEYTYLLIDIDDTLCKTPKFDSITAFNNLNLRRFKPIKDVVEYVQELIDCRKFKIIFITYRSEILLTDTNAWLHKYLSLDPKGYSLIMRPENNYDPAYKFKLDTLAARGIRPKHVVTWIDDDPEINYYALAAGFNLVHPNNLLRRGL